MTNKYLEKVAEKDKDSRRSSAVATGAGAAAGSLAGRAIGKGVSKQNIRNAKVDNKAAIRHNQNARKATDANSAVRNVGKAVDSSKSRGANMSKARIARKAGGPVGAAVGALAGILATRKKKED